MLLRALLEAPGLRLRLLTGEQAVGRRITGVFTTDLLDPRRYLSGGEIVLTGLMWRRMPGDSETFVLSLAQSGVTALAAGDAALGSVPPDLVDACRRHSLPLLEVPVDVSFAAITEHVLRASAGFGPPAAWPRLPTGADVGAAALSSGRSEAPAPSEDAVAALFAAAAREYGLVGWVVSPVGRLVLGSGHRPEPCTEAPWPALAVGYLSALELPVTVTVDGEPFSLGPVAGPPAHRLADWFVAFEGDSEDWDEERREVARELTRLTAAFRAGCRERRRSRRRPADELLRQVLARLEDAAELQPGPVAAEMRRCGISAGQRVVAVVAGLSGVAGPQTVAGPAGPQAVAGAAGSEPGAGAAGPDSMAGSAQGWQVAGAAAPDSMAGSAEPHPGAGVGAKRWRTVGEAQRLARAVLEEMLPDAPVGLCGDQVVALAPCESNAAIGGAHAEAVALGAGVPPRTAGADAILDRVRAAVRTVRTGLPGLNLSLGLSVTACETSAAAKPRGQTPRATGEKGRPRAAVGHVTPTGFAADARNDSAAELAVISVCRAIDEARQAGRLASLLGGGAQLVDSAQLGSHSLLLALVPEEARRTFRTRVLGPVLAYDRQHGTELVHTLEVFLGCSGSWTKAAEKMYVHVNSLRYRVRRIEELTGRDLGSLTDQTDLLLALRLSGSGDPA